MMQLNTRLYIKIKELCKIGDEFASSGDFENAIENYSYAKNLLPEPIYEWEAATWIFVALGDAFFLKGAYTESLNNFCEAQKCVGGIGNPFILLRLGQCYFEINNIKYAREYLMQAYIFEGKKIFDEEDVKYLNFIRGDI